MRRALLVLVDGMRPDALQRAHTPIIDRLIATGASTMAARTVEPSITLPCIASLFLSVSPQVHGVTTNDWSADRARPSLFDAVARSGHTAASFYNWEQLRDLSRPGSLQAGVYLNNCYEPLGAGDTELSEAAVATLGDAPVDLAFVYLGHVDAAGHDHGWMSDAYLRGIENADACVGLLTDGLKSGHDEWLTVVTADHGGHGTGHGTASPDDMTVPIVLCGAPAIAPRAQLPGGISIIDIAPTIAQWLGVPTPSEWQGQPIELT